MSTNGAMQTNRGKDRLIVALDVPDHEQAIALVQELDNVLFFKIGLELIVAGNIPDLIETLQSTRSGQGGIFIDLKVSGDIGNTITRFVRVCATHRITLITLGGPAEHTIKSGVIQTAVEARGESDCPKILGVPLLSSTTLSRADTDGTAPSGVSSDAEYIVQTGKALIDAGCDGLIVSGQAIQACKDVFQSHDALQDKLIVSPGIRPSNTGADDHKRFTTPAEAIELGADFLVVGRPILNASNKKSAAQRIIQEIDDALARNPSLAG